MIPLSEQEKRQMGATYDRALGVFRPPTRVELGQADIPIAAKAPPKQWYKDPPILILGGLGLMVLITILTRKED